MLRPDADSHEARGQPRQERQRLEDSRGKQTPSLPDAGPRSRRLEYFCYLVGGENREGVPGAQRSLRLSSLPCSLIITV
jgi:hypothetical protein